MKNIENYIDMYGCISRIENGRFTGGDSLSYAGFHALLQELSGISYKDKYKKRYVRHITPGQEIPSRHPNLSHPNWSDIHFTSRDQLITNIAYWNVIDNQGEAKRILKLLAKNYFCFWNTAKWDGEKVIYNAKKPDLMKLEYLRILLAACNFWYLYPFFLICDLTSIFNSIFKVLYAFVYPHHSDDQSRIAVLLAMKNKYPSPLSYISRKIYELRPAFNYTEYYHVNETFWFLDSKRRKQVLENFKYNRKIYGPQWAMDVRFGVRDMGQPPLNGYNFKELLK